MAPATLTRAFGQGARYDSGSLALCTPALSQTLSEGVLVTYREVARIVSRAQRRSRDEVPGMFAGAAITALAVRTTHA